MLLVGKTLLLTAEDGRAEPPKASLEAGQKQTALKLFEEAEAAYRNGDFIRAAEMFEEAYRQTPHPAPLWNAARAWSHAGELTAAANAYAKYLREAPADALDRDAAQSELALLKQKLGLVEIYTKDAEDVRLDDKPVDSRSLYVSPGKHVLEGRVKGTMLRQTESIEAGATRSMILVEPEGEKPSPKPPPLAPKNTHILVAKEKPPQGTWALPTLLTAGAATTVSITLLAWSGFDTLAARRDFDEAPTDDKLLDGKDKQLRTNVLLGISVGLGAATAGIFSYWIGKPSAAKRPSLALAPMLQGDRASEIPHGLLLVGSF